jgi:outer membrane lipoprotein SlyB
MALTATLSACATGVGAGDYTRSAVGQVNKVEEAIVVSVRPIRIEGERTLVGTASGAAIGGLAGSQIGGGDEERAIGTVAGAVVGGVVGSQIEKGVTAQRGVEYVLRLANGELRTISQGDDVVLPVGARAFIVYGARARVIPRD